MEVRSGYKRTEAGVIPEDWEAKTLGALVNYKNGAAHEQNITDSGRFVVVNSKFISTDGFTRKYSEHCFCPASKGDVLMVMSDVPNGRAIAKCYWVESDNAYTVNQRICVLNPQGIDGKLLFYKLNRNPFYLAFDDGAKQTNLRKDDVLSCPLGIPESETEQRAIATALSDVDGLLGGLDRLIAKKRDLKQAAMQQLLNGQTRLPGFHGEWEVKTFGELCDYVDGVPTTGGDLGYLEIGDVNVESKSYNVSQKEKPSVRGAVKVPAGTLLISTVRPTRGAIVITKSSLHVSSAFCRVRPVNGLLFHLVCQPRFLAYLGENSIGGTYPTCRDETILNYASALPSDHAEQTAIAEVLSDMDAELAALEQRRDKTRALKQGMMQELLTGRTRLV